MHNRRHVLILGLVLAAGYLPFLGKAFHIDDRIYLDVAVNILEKPLHPYDFRAIHEGYAAPDAASHSHLPLTSYYLAALKLLTGSSSEWPYHLAFLVFPALAAAGFYDLSRRLVRHHLAATCLLLVAPGFLVLGHTIMTDVPFLALWIFALSRFVRVVEGEATRADRLLGWLSILGAAFLSLFTLGLLLLMGAYFLARRSVRPAGGGRRLAILLFFLLPPLLWGAWYLKDYLHYDRFVLINTVLHLNKREAFEWGLIAKKGLSFLLNLGAVFLFPAALWYGLGGRWSARIAALVFLAAFFPFFVGPWAAEGARWTFIHQLLFALFLSTGIVVLAGLLRLGIQTLRDGRERLERPPPSESPQRKWAAPAVPLAGLMLLWFLGITCAYLFVFYSGSARYALLALPPVVLLWVHGLERRIKEPYFLRNLVWLGFFLTAAYSGAIAYADYRYAGIYRETARQLVRDYQEPGRTVWFAGEWGYRYYMLQEGGRILTKIDPNPEPGDIIIKPFVAMPWVTLVDGDEYTDLLEQRYVEMGYPVRILDFSAQAGFYSTGWGILPVSWKGDERWEWFNVFRVKKKYTGPIPELERPW